MFSIPILGYVMVIAGAILIAISAVKKKLVLCYIGIALVALFFGLGWLFDSNILSRDLNKIGLDISFLVGIFVVYRNRKKTIK